MDTNEFDFDFEKEYGFDPHIMDSDQDDLDFDDEFLTGEEDQLEIDLNDPIFYEEPQDDQEVQEAFPDTDPYFGELTQDDSFLDEFLLDDQDDRQETEPEQIDEDEAPYIPEQPEEADNTEDASEPEMVVPVRRPRAPRAEKPALTPAERKNERRRKRQQMRHFKEELLPKIIAGVALLLILIFIIGAISRAVSKAKDKEDALDSLAQSTESESQRLENESKALLAEAAALAAGYDYDSAIAKLDSFSGELSAFSEMVSKKSEYSQMIGRLKEWNDPSKIPNLAFHVLIADPSRAFVDETYGRQYNKNFVTTDEFSKILQQLYDNGYVLVGLDDIFLETTSEDGTVSYSANTIYLPEGKKPIMITETLVNYFEYMIDGDRNGEPDARGDGFASRLVVDSNGEIKAEMVTAEGETVTGDYDLVPILNSFIKENPDFSYRGAKALLAVTGEEGVFGYRCNKSYVSTRGKDYYETQVAGAQQIAQALRDDGYEIGCYSYANIPYGDGFTAQNIQTDLEGWTQEIVPVLGPIDILVYVRDSDIKDYSGGKYNVVYSSGFRYFINATNTPWADITNDYVRQSRLMVTGSQMAYSSHLFSDYSDSMSVLNSQRGTVPN